MLIVYRDNDHRVSCNKLSKLYMELYNKESFKEYPVSTIEAYSKILFDNFKLFEELVKSK